MNSGEQMVNKSSGEQWWTNGEQLVNSGEQLVNSGEQLVNTKDLFETPSKKA